MHKTNNTLIEMQSARNFKEASRIMKLYSENWANSITGRENDFHHFGNKYNHSHVCTIFEVYKAQIQICDDIEVITNFLDAGLKLKMFPPVHTITTVCITRLT